MEERWRNWTLAAPPLQLSFVPFKRFWLLCVRFVAFLSCCSFFFFFCCSLGGFPRSPSSAIAALFPYGDWSWPIEKNHWFHPAHHFLNELLQSPWSRRKCAREGAWGWMSFFFLSLRWNPLFGTAWWNTKTCSLNFFPSELSAITKRIGNWNGNKSLKWKVAQPEMYTALVWNSCGFS